MRSDVRVDRKWLFKRPVTSVEKISSSFLCISQLLLTYKTKVSKVIFANSSNSDCKVNLVLHCCDFLVMGNANLVIIKP